VKHFDPREGCAGWVFKVADLEVFAFYPEPEYTTSPRAVPFNQKGDREMLTNNIPSLGARANCCWCGKPFRLQRLAQRFCSPTCRKIGHRHKATTGALRSVTLGGDTVVGGLSPKNASTINQVQRAIARLSPVHLVGGGYRWQDATPLDPALCRAIIRVEIGGQLRKPPQEQNAVLYNEAA
jgi:hypothetical protein